MVHVIVEPGPGRVAGLDAQAALERPRIVVGQHQPIGLLEQQVLEVLDLLDRRPLDLEVADLVAQSLDQVDLQLVARALRRRVVNRRLPWLRPSLSAGRTDLDRALLPRSCAERATPALALLLRIVDRQRPGADRLDDQNGAIDEGDSIERLGAEQVGGSDRCAGPVPGHVPARGVAQVAAATTSDTNRDTRDDRKGRDTTRTPRLRVGGSQSLECQGSDGSRQKSGS